MPPPVDALRKFLLENGCGVRKEEQGRAHTHLCMTGGKYHIAPELLEGFYAAYGAEIERGNTSMSIVEVNTRVHKLHFDVDFPERMDDEQLHAFCALLHDTVAEYYQGAHVAVACASYDSSKQRTGKGLHVIFPSILVTTDVARVVYAGVLARCEDRLPAHRGRWETILDFSVMRENGSLRMIGSDKAQRCHVCGNHPSQRGNCQPCQAHGNIYSDKVYWPWRVFSRDPDEAEKKMRELENRTHALKLCSVRSSAEAPNKDFQPPPGAPLPVVLGRGGATLKRAHEDHSTPKGCSELLDLSEQQLQDLSLAIRDYDDRYRELVVYKVTRKRALREIYDRCFIAVRGFNERFCLNKGAEHNRSNIYFQVCHKGLAQKCWCKKKDVRRSGQCCGAFEGPYRSLPPRLFEALLQRESARTTGPSPCGGSGGAASEDGAWAPGEAAPQRKRQRSSDALQAFVSFGDYFLITPDRF